MEKMEKKIEINNCFTLENTEFKGTAITGRFHDTKNVELENGVWLESCGDGRYYDAHENQYCEVNCNTYDGEGNLLFGERLGWVEC